MKSSKSSLTAAQSAEMLGRLQEACRANDVEEVQHLLDEGMSVNQAFRFGETPLMLACKKGSVRIARLLINTGARVSQVGKGDSPLHVACKAGNLELMRLVLSAGADVNALDKFGKTALVIACEWDERGDEEMLSLLIRNGANVDIPTKEGFTAVYIAVQRNRPQLLYELLQAGADTNAYNGPRRELALHQACWIERQSKRVVEWLLKSGADPNKRNGCRHTALLTARQSHEIMELLLKHGADPNASDPNFGTPLAYAVVMTDVPLVRLLIEYKADVNKPDADGYTALGLACRSRSYHYSDGNEKLEPTMYDNVMGVSAYYADIVHVLVHHGPAVTILFPGENHSITSYFDERYDEKREKERFVVLANLFNAVPEPNVHASFGRLQNTALLELCSCSVGDSNSAMLLIAYQADIHYKNVQGNTALHLAAKARLGKLVKDLIVCGADVNARGRFDATPLIYASAYYSDEVVTELLSHGADVHAVCSNGITALIAAAVRNSRNIARKLLDLGADVNHVDSRGATAIYYACKYQNLSVIALLLERGADINIGKEQGLDGFALLTPKHQQFVTEQIAKAKAPVDIPLK